MVPSSAFAILTVFVYFVTISLSMFLKSAQKGFSLVEIMVVISIIALLSIVSIGTLTTIQKNNRDAKRQSDLRLIQGALQQFYSDRNHYPNDLATVLSAGTALTDCSGEPVGCVTSKTYLSQVPKDPQSGTTTPYCYRSQIANVTSGSGTGNCGILAGQGAGTCHFYNLCANLENSANGAAGCSCSASYNFKVTPL